MIDLGLLREKRNRVVELLEKKDPAYNVRLLGDLDEKVCALRSEVESLRHEKNQLAKEARGGVTPELRERSVLIGEKLKVKEVELDALEIQFHDLYLHCPNIPEDDIPVGNKESNRVVKTEGVKPEYNFTVKNHLELGKQLGWFDFEAAARMTGANFALYKGDAVKSL